MTVYRWLSFTVSNCVKGILGLLQSVLLSNAARKLMSFGIQHLDAWRYFWQPQDCLPNPGPSRATTLRGNWKLCMARWDKFWPLSAPQKRLWRFDPVAASQRYKNTRITYYNEIGSAAVMHMQETMHIHTAQHRLQSHVKLALTQCAHEPPLQIFACFLEAKTFRIYCSRPVNNNPTRKLKKKHNKTENLYGITSRHGIATPAEYWRIVWTASCE